VISFARDSRERLRPERGTEWDEGELCVVPGLAEIGWSDCFRTLHGYAAKEPSWTYPRFGGGYRIDHIFCSPALEPRSCAYHHDWRDAGLSDHSALEADLERLP
jgi:endonuclease/exonuclease/phosphatase family metal-dependent hydrolase